MGGLVVLLVLWRLLPVFGLLLLVDRLGGGNLGRGLISLLALIVLVAAVPLRRPRHRRAQRQAAADLDYLHLQAEVVAEAQYRAWEQRQYHRELAALHHPPR